jgi:hypothetical protein
VALPAALLAAGLTPPASAALSRGLVDATVGASLGFAGRRATEAALASDLAISLARGVLYAMTISKLKTLGVAVLACALALGGAQTLTLGQSGHVTGTQEPGAAAAVREGDDSVTAVSRSVDKLESELNETARRNSEMRKDLRKLRAGLKALGAVPRTSAAVEGAAHFAGALEPPPAQDVTRLAEQLKRHPVEPSESPDRVGLYMLDLRNGEVTLIADRPGPGLTRCGSPTWSNDGRRILFDATPGTEWNLTRLWSIELGNDRPTVRDIGDGNCPTPSPEDDRIFFLSNGAQSGIWLMKADGSGRQLFGDYGKPAWSPDGRQLMIVSFADPRRVMVMDADPAKSGVVELPGHQIFWHTNWAGKGTIVAVVGRTAGDTLALVDVSDPREAKIKEVLWRRANGPDVQPLDPIYSAATGRCVFVGSKTALYSVQHGNTGPAKLVKSQESHPWIRDTAYSPDGRYVLYIATSPARVKGKG